MIRWAGHDTDLFSSSNISKTVRVNVVFTQNIFERIFDKLSNDTQVDRLCTYGPPIIDA